MTWGSVLIALLVGLCVGFFTGDRLARSELTCFHACGLHVGMPITVRHNQVTCACADGTIERGIWAVRDIMPVDERF